MFVILSVSSKIHICENCFPTSRFQAYNPNPGFHSKLWHFYLAWSLSNEPGFTSSRFILWLVVMLFAGILAWLTGSKLPFTRNRMNCSKIFRKHPGGFPEVQRRLDSVLQLNHSLLNAQDEKELMDTHLR
jgi:hypothetical protein